MAEKGIVTMRNLLLTIYTKQHLFKAGQCSSIWEMNLRAHSFPLLATTTSCKLLKLKFFTAPRFLALAFIVSAA
uniref:Uncharacterized protein n=1 Tax=Romanomermis culicivorax TaxID=13658 RepID=A0A915KGA0_ROMCU